GDGQGQSCPRPNRVEQPPGEHLAAAVRDAKRDHQPREIGVRPSELGFEVWRQHVERLAIDVVDDGRKEQQRADIPAQMPDGWTAAQTVIFSRRMPAIVSPKSFRRLGSGTSQASSIASYRRTFTSICSGGSSVPKTSFSNA